MTVINLPSAANSYLAFRKAGNGWLIEIVTPLGALPPLRTAVERCPDAETANVRGAEIADAMHRPFKARRSAR